MRPTWLVVVAVLCVSPAWALEGSAPLDERLDAVLASPALRGARVAALVVREPDGEVLYEHSPDRALTPASNTKILTAIAALASFGPTYRFETLLLADRPLDHDGGVGTLYLRGGGDPALGSEDWWRLAADLRRAGLRRVRGDIVLDDSAFDRERWHPAWGKTGARAYHAPVSGLSANYGSFAVTISAGQAPGDPARVEVDPPVDYFLLSNRARSAPAGLRRALVADRGRGEGAEIVTVAGSIPVDSKARTYYRSVLDPTRYAGSVLAMQLRANGIVVDGGIRLGAAPPTAVELLRFEGKALSEIVRLFVKYSNNAVAESLVKAMGAQSTGGIGSWSTGVPAMRAQLVELGLDPDGFSLVDGSGLAYENKITPRTLVHALRLARASFDFGPELVAALPISARDGTLAKRAEDAASEVRAKTGTLTRVTSLSGLAHLGARAGAGSRDVAVFSILVNGYRVSDGEAMDSVDRFVAELVRPEPDPSAPASH